MFALREAYVAPIASRRPRVVVSVSGAVLGDDFYKDDMGGLWKYEYQESGSMVVPGKTRASTDQYGGVTTAWYDNTLFNSHPDALNADIESKAIAYSALADAGDGSSGSKPKPSGGITSRPPRPKSKPSGGGGGGGGSIADAIDESMTPSEPPTAGSSTFVILLGMLGVGVIVWKLIS